MRTYTYDLEMPEYLTAIVHVFVWLKAHPVTEPLAAEIVPLKDEWKTVFLNEIQLNENLAEADARVLLLDLELDVLFNAIVNSLMTAANNNRNAAIVVRFLGKDRPADIRKPVLGPQLERLRTWPPTLAKIASDEVKKHGAALAALVPRADEGVEVQRKADNALTDFTDLGERKTFVDHLNGTFRRLEGKIGELLHTPEGASLPADFKERCFPAQSRSRGPTIKSEERTVARLKAQLARHEAMLADLKEDQAAGEKAREQAERDAIEQEAAELKKDAEAKLARIAELEAKLKKPDA